MGVKGVSKTQIKIPTEGAVRCREKRKSKILLRNTKEYMKSPQNKCSIWASAGKAKEASETTTKKHPEDEEKPEINGETKVVGKVEGGVKVAAQSHHQSSSFREDTGESKHTEE